MHPLQKTTPRIFGLSTEALQALGKQHPFYKTLYAAALHAPARLAFARKVVRQMQISNIYKTHSRSKK